MVVDVATELESTFARISRSSGSQARSVVGAKPELGVTCAALFRSSRLASPAVPASECLWTSIIRYAMLKALIISLTKISFSTKNMSRVFTESEQNDLMTDGV